MYEEGKIRRRSLYVYMVYNVPDLSKNMFSLNIKCLQKNMYVKMYIKEDSYMFTDRIKYNENNCGRILLVRMLYVLLIKRTDDINNEINTADMIKLDSS